MPICLAFVDYEKAFDSIEFEPLFKALEHQGVNPTYIAIIRDIYNGATSTLKLHKDSEKIQLERGARQGDNISPKLFTACLQHNIINAIDWTNKGINIDGEFLSHLIFADDIVLLAHHPKEIEQMLTSLNEASRPVGLKMHVGKTKVMLNPYAVHEPIRVDGNTIEAVDKYVYLGKTITRTGDIDEEIKKRIGLGWNAFGKWSHILKNREASPKVKKRLMDTYILPVMTYAAETWALSEAQLESLAIAQRKMERQMIGVSLLDHKTNTWIREQTQIEDIRKNIKESKHRWAGHVARMTDNRWTSRTTIWQPRLFQRGRGRPSLRWRDEIDSQFGRQWMRKAKDRGYWKMVREGLLHRVNPP